MLGHPPVVNLVDLVKHEIQKIESGDQGRRQVDVLRNGQFGVVTRVDRVCSGQNGRPRVEGGDNTGLGDRNGLLLLIDVSDASRPEIGPTHHNLVQYTSCRIGHLVKLVDAAYTAVGEDEGSTLQHELLRVWVSGHICCETDCRRAFARGVDASRGDLVHILYAVRL